MEGVVREGKGKEKALGIGLLVGQADYRTPQFDSLQYKKLPEMMMGRGEMPDGAWGWG